MEIFLKGIIIGLSISVPLGPIGMLCIQRTLNRGQKFGLVTGLGATTSDVVYAIVTMFFLNIVIGFIEQHQLVIQLVGSVVIAFFGYWIYQSNPMAQPRPNEKSDGKLFNDFITSFGLTLSNPLILFVLIALFSQTEFVSSTTSIWVHIFCLFSIVLGATLWWVILTSLASRFRYKFNMRGLKIINRITGVIIMMLGIAGAVMIFIK